MGGLDDHDVERKLAELPSLEPWRRAEALMEMGWSRVGRSTPGIRPFVDDPSPLVRIAAAQALWQTDHVKEELAHLVAVLVGGLCQNDEDLSLMAGTALVQMENAAIEPLMRLFWDRGGKDARIVRVLGEMADETTAEKVKSFLVENSRSKRDEVAKEAKEALTAFDTRSF